MIFHHRLMFDGLALAPATTTATGDSEPITLTGLAVPWNVTAQANWWGDTMSFAPGSVAADDPARVPFLLDHRAAAMGYGVCFVDTGAGLEATVAIPRDELTEPDTARAVRQMGNGVRSALSVGVVVEAADEEPGAERGTTHYTITAARLVELSSVLIPRFDDARHGRVAAGAEPDELEPDETEPDDDDTEPEDTAMADDDEDTRAANHRAATTRASATTTRPRGQFATLGHYLQASALGQIDAAYQAVIRNALADVLTGNIPGLLPEAWLADVVQLMAGASPTVESFRQVPLPDAGMTVNIPVVTQLPDVGIQATEKTQIPTRTMTIDPGAFPVKTFAGGQDVSIQAVQRSTPAYLEVLGRAYLVEMTIQVETAVAAAFAAGATAGPPLSAADLNGSIVAGAAQLLTTVGRFPEVLVMAVDVWQAFAVAEGTDGRPLFPSMSPVNPLGTLDITSPNGNVRGLAYSVSPYLAAGTALMGVREAAITLLGPVAMLSADVPAVLGRDVAVYRFGAYGVVDARGVIKFTLGATQAANASKRAS